MGEHIRNTINNNIQHATPPTSKLARVIEKKRDECDSVEVQQPEYSQPRWLKTLKFLSNEKVDEGDDTTKFSNFKYKNPSLSSTI